MNVHHAKNAQSPRDPCTSSPNRLLDILTEAEKEALELGVPEVIVCIQLAIHLAKHN